MLIKVQLRLATLLPVAFAALIGSLMWISWIKVEQARADAEIAEKVLLSNFEQNILTQEYLLYGGGRVESQLRIRNQSTGDLLAQLNIVNPMERGLIDELRQGNHELGNLYALLLEGNSMAREQLAGALLVKSQAMRTKTQQFVDMQLRQVVESQRLADQSIMVALVLLAGATAVLLLLLARRLIRGIDELGDGVRRVAAGDLGYRIPLASADELGALASSFNDMSHRLRDSTTSIDNLSNEVARRQQAEAGIRQLNAELEERVLQRTSELEAANKELEAFSYSVSHDLRAPLRAIDGFSHKVTVRYSDKLDDEGRRQLQVVRDNAQRMGQLIDDLLAFSRMGRREMIAKSIDMAAMAKGVADELRAAEPQRLIEFAFLPLPQISGDAAMIRQVWVNLLSNAIKFSCQRAVARIEVGGATEGAEVVYWVRDNGVGFDMQYAEKLFGVFQRLHRQDEFEGTGVGLAIAKRILHRHHGRIWGEGTPGRGAIFRFALPLHSTHDQLSGETAS